jgi:hypothetical protein
MVALNCECYLMPCDWFEVGHRADASDRLAIHTCEWNSKTSITHINSAQYRSSVSPYLLQIRVCVACVLCVLCVWSRFLLYRLKNGKRKMKN